MTRLDCITNIKNQIDETDTDPQIDIILDKAINFAYCYDLGKLDKRIKTATLTVTNGLATLPEDLFEIEQITPALTDADRIVGNCIITTQVSFDIIYSYNREALTSDSDTLDISFGLINPIELYACYSYYKYKKKVDMANLYFGEYQNAKQDYINSKHDFIDEVVIDSNVESGEEDD